MINSRLKMLIVTLYPKKDTSHLYKEVIVKGTTRLKLFRIVICLYLQGWKQELSHIMIHVILELI